MPSERSAVAAWPFSSRGLASRLGRGIDRTGASRASSSVSSSLPPKLLMDPY